jgi:mannitol/fructose-specific phosphotransferase system IIA component (Ntr-type)
MPIESPADSRNGSTLADFTRLGLIIPSLRGRDVASVLQELSQALHQAGCVADLLPFYHAALNREFLVSTDMEPGLACPHARLPGLKQLYFAYGRSEPPLTWGGGAGRSIHGVFLLAVPATDSAQYLRLVSGLVRLGQDTALLRTLRQATDAAQILRVLTEVRLRARLGVDAGQA